jgi:hypothetical protein
VCGLIFLVLTVYVGFLLAGPLGGIVAFFGFAILYTLAEMSQKRGEQ